MREDCDPTESVRDGELSSRPTESEHPGMEINVYENSLKITLTFVARIKKITNFFNRAQID